MCCTATAHPQKQCHMTILFVFDQLWVDSSMEKWLIIWDTTNGQEVWWT